MEMAKKRHKTIINNHINSTRWQIFFCFLLFQENDFLNPKNDKNHPTTHRLFPSVMILQ